MSAIIMFDDSCWPLLLLRVTGPMTDKQFGEFLAQSTTYVERGERYVSIFDIAQAGLPSPTQRQMQVEWIRKYDAQLRERVLGNANIITSAPLRLALSLIFHLKPLPMPYAAVPDMDSALRFVIGKLEEAGLGEDAARIRRQFGVGGVRAG
ncbi:hypothetical protein ATI61_105288 [Archangium gephyra]|uniref:STAS/SEC14 domain-containing protein n=1 Tax=Archangium gephyra TaxID=48 RepID=A0AAC8THY9_9BACT|nr:hypothetical protein [Archangium gephyra]AKJ06737.1 Hypothetical protein AA314_08363 [Archangium gephyra]REG31961.1 hypothetical protein ATI61_105288 [Archangium gephyra]